MTFIGLASLCALALTALGASSASAVTSGATAYTCVEGGTGGHGTKFKTSHCTEESSIGGFGHLAIPADETTTLTTTSEGSTILEGKLFGASVAIEATSVECVGCSFHNHLNGEVHEVTGTGRLRFNVVRVGNCDIEEDVVGGLTNTFTTEPLKFTTTNPGTLKFEPVVPPVFATFKIKEFAPTCPLVGTVILVGAATGTLAGSTLTFNVTKASEELKLEGEKASLKGKLTLKGGKPETGIHHPIALTGAPF
jgi:hypothetical protein